MIEKCNICDKKVNQNSAVLCQNCKRWSHAKCNLSRSKNVSHVWMCRQCKCETFPFENAIDDLSTTNLRDANRNNLKPYFDSLNYLTNKSNSLDIDENDDITLINCKYYTCDEFNSTFSDSDYFSFFHTNIASLEKHFDELSTLLSTLNHSFDFIAISETRLKPQSLSNISLSNYSFINTPSETSAGGVGLYISSKYSFKHRQDLNQKLYSTGLLESVFAEVVFRSKKNVIVGCIYKHPPMHINDFLNVLSPILSIINKENKTLVLLGDFNIDLLSCSSCILHDSFLDLLACYNILPHITLPTRVTNESSTLIDNIFLSPVPFASISGNLTSCLSDHLPQFLLIKMSDRNQNTPTGFYRKWSQFNKQKFAHEFSTLDWNAILALEHADVDSSFNAFMDNLSSLINQHVPINKFTRRQQKLQNKPWITMGILTSIRVRNKYFCDFHKTSSPELKKIFAKMLQKLSE